MGGDRSEAFVADCELRPNVLYDRSDLVAMGFTTEFIEVLTLFYGLLPLGAKKFRYEGSNVIESLRNHAQNNIVDLRREAANRKQLRAMRRERLKTKANVRG